MINILINKFNLKNNQNIYGRIIVQKLKTKLENYQQLSKEIRNLLLIKNFNESIENNQKLQTAIVTVKKAIEQENQLESMIGMLVYSK